MENLDLFDIDRIRTGRTMLRGTPRPEGLYRMIVHICLFGSDGRMLIQQRQPFKTPWAGLWDLSAGGSAVAGENSRQAARRELREELGLDLDLSACRPALTVNWEGGFDDIYTLTADPAPDSLRLQEEEVRAVRWASREEIERMIDEGSFIPYEKSLIGMLFFLRDHVGFHTRKDQSR